MRTARSSRHKTRHRASPTRKTAIMIQTDNQHSATVFGWLRAQRQKLRIGKRHR